MERYPLDHLWPPFLWWRWRFTEEHWLFLHEFAHQQPRKLSCTCSTFWSHLLGLRSKVLVYLSVFGHCNESSSNILGFLNGYDHSDSGYFAQFPHFTIWHLTNFHALIFDKFPHFDIWQISTLWWAVPCTWQPVIEIQAQSPLPDILHDMTERNVFLVTTATTI